jgi:transposase InsO family protein
LSFNRSTLYYVPAKVSAEETALMKAIDRIFTKWPFYGSRRITRELRRLGHDVNRKRVQRLMRVMGLEALVPGPHTSKPHPEHKVYPYLLRQLEISRPNQVWAADITYIPLESGWGYLIAIIDWYSRAVLAWRLSNTMTVDFCVQTLKDALPTRQARDLQQRPGRSVHQPRVHRSPAKRRRRHPHGRQGSRHRQHLRRAPLALAQVRRRLAAPVTDAPCNVDGEPCRGLRLSFDVVTHVPGLFWIPAMTRTLRVPSSRRVLRAKHVGLRSHRVRDAWRRRHRRARQQRHQPHGNLRRYADSRVPIHHVGARR